MVTVGLIGAIPLVAFAAYQLTLHLILADDHVAFDHYVMMAAGLVTIGIGAVLASMKPTGWRFLAYGSAALLTLIAVASIAFPEPAQGVNFGIVGGILALVWVAVYLGVAEGRITPWAAPSP